MRIGAHLIELTEKEFQDCLEFTRRRTAHRIATSSDRWFDEAGDENPEQTKERARVNSVCGERAFGNLVGIEPDMVEGYPVHYDFRIARIGDSANPLRFDLKTGKNEDSDLNVNEGCASPPKRCDAYVLVTPASARKFWIVGWIEAFKLFLPHQKTNGKWGPGSDYYYMHQNLLDPFVINEWIVPANDELF